MENNENYNVNNEQYQSNEDINTYEEENNIEVGLNSNKIELLESLVKYSIIINGVLGILGLIFCFFSSSWIRVCGIFAGLLCIMDAAFTCYLYLKRDGAKIYSLNLLFGFFSALVGLLLIAYPYNTMDYVLIFLGVYLIIKGLLNANYGVWLLIGKEKSWLLCVTIGLMLVAFGILVIFNPFVTLKIPVVTGIFFIIHSVLEITISSLFKNRKQEIVEIFW